MDTKPIMEERINEPTPNGGAYSVAYYLDKNWAPVEKSKAELIIIHECAENGDVINEIIGCCLE